MKSKMVTYVLLLCVLLIWGYIAYRLLNRKGDYIPNKTIVQIQDHYNWEDMLLLLNYECPFMKNSELPRSETVKTKGVMIETRETVLLVSFGVIVRDGVNYFPIAIDNNVYTLKQGESARGFLFKGFKKDSLYFEKRGNKYSVKLNHTNEK